MALWRDVGLGRLNVATFWCVVNTLILGAFIVVGLGEGRATRGNADPTDVDLADAVAEEAAPEPLNLDIILTARQRVGLLAEGETS